MEFIFYGCFIIGGFLLIKLYDFINRNYSTPIKYRFYSSKKLLHIIKHATHTTSLEDFYSYQEIDALYIYAIKFQLDYDDWVFVNKEANNYMKVMKKAIDSGFDIINNSKRLVKLQEIIRLSKIHI